MLNNGYRYAIPSDRDAQHTDSELQLAPGHVVDVNLFYLFCTNSYRSVFNPGCGVHYICSMFQHPMKPVNTAFFMHHDVTSL
jgi:hypothetical protein